MMGIQDNSVMLTLTNVPSTHVRIMVPAWTWSTTSPASVMTGIQDNSVMLTLTNVPSTHVRIMVPAWTWSTTSPASVMTGIQNDSVTLTSMNVPLTHVRIMPLVQIVLAHFFVVALLVSLEKCVKLPSTTVPLVPASRVCVKILTSLGLTPVAALLALQAEIAIWTTSATTFSK